MPTRRSFLCYGTCLTGLAVAGCTGRAPGADRTATDESTSTREPTSTQEPTPGGESIPGDGDLRIDNTTQDEHTVTVVVIKYPEPTGDHGRGDSFEPTPDEPTGSGDRVFEKTVEIDPDGEIRYEDVFSLPAGKDEYRIFARTQTGLSGAHGFINYENSGLAWVEVSIDGSGLSFGAVFA